MVVLHTCKSEEDPIKNKEARVLTRLYVIFFRHWAANSEVSGGILPKFLLVGWDRSFRLLLGPPGLN